MHVQTILSSPFSIDMYQTGTLYLACDVVEATSLASFV